MNKFVVSLILFVVLMVPSVSAQQNTTVLDSNPGMVGPGSMFYGLELAIDRASMNAGIKSPQDVAAERASEALVATEQNNTEGAQQALDNINEISKNTDISENGTSKTMQILEEVKRKTPVQAQQGIQTAIDNANKAGGNPPTQGPQENKPETPNMPENNANNTDNPGNMTEMNETQNLMEGNNTQPVNQTQEQGSQTQDTTSDNTTDSTQDNQTDNNTTQETNQTRP